MKPIWNIGMAFDLQPTVIVFILCLSLVTATSPDGRPTLWLGVPPNCTRTESDCAVFGFEHVRSDSQRCNEGSAMILCASPAPLKQPIDTPAHTINVLSYNVYERDWFIAQDGQRERTCRIPHALNDELPELDVIGFQESFMHGCWPKQVSLRDLLRQHGFLYITETIGPAFVDYKKRTKRDILGLKVTNGGCFIASRWPILQQSAVIFQSAHAASADAFANKGIVYAKIEKKVSGKSKIYHVFDTHFQAGSSRPEAREGQAQEFYRFIKSLNIPETEPVLLAGDFNMNLRTRTEHVNTLLDYMNATYPYIVGDLSTTHRNSEDNWIDYVLYSREHEQPISATMRTITPRSKEPFPICYSQIPIVNGLHYVWPNDEECTPPANITNIFDLSDHYASYGNYIFSS